MSRFSTFLAAAALASGLALLPAAASADALAGAWTLGIGKDDAGCSVTFAVNGTETAGSVASAGGCSDAAGSIARWRVVGKNLNLLSPSGALIAFLKPAGENRYEGQRVKDSRKVVLSR